MNTRLFVSASLSNGAELHVEGEQARYLGRVLRCRIGDSIVVFNGNGGEWSASIRSISKSSVELIVGEQRETDSESPLRLHLVQGISRGERMDFVVQKATELGVKRITPVLTDHGMVKLDGTRARKRREHWQRVAESACEQSGRTRPPLVEEPIALNTWFGTADRSDSTELILKPGAQASLTSFEKPQFKLCLLIGPEGGFSDREHEDAEVAGFTPVSLGPRILRTETAALAAIVAAQLAWGDMKD